MRDLKLPALYRGSPLFTTEEDFDEAREIRRLSGRIIAAASAIDQMISEVLLGTIFREVIEQRELVLGSVLNTDWCSFSSKRKMLSIQSKNLTYSKEQKNHSLMKNSRGSCNTETLLLTVILHITLTFRNFTSMKADQSSRRSMKPTSKSWSEFF